MQYRHLRNFEERVSLLGYGCMRFPVREDDPSNIVEEEAEKLIDQAIASGITYFDTAYPYHGGRSEEVSSRILRKYPRSSYYLADKLPIWLIKKDEDTKRYFEEQLVRCQVEYFDIYLVHSLDRNKYRICEQYHVFDTLKRLKEEGKIRHLGFSFHDDAGLLEQILDDHSWDFVQIQLNYVDYRHASGINFNADYLYDELDKRGIPVVVMEPLLGGRLASLTDYLNARLKQHRPQESVASWAFRFAGTYPEVLTVLSGMTLMEHLQDNLRSYAPLKPLTDSELAFLQEIATEMVGLNTIPCNDCKYCMPCPYGIDIPANLLYYNKCVNEGNVPHEAQDAAYRKSRRAFLIGYDRSVPKLRQADHCIACGECVSHCPQRIKIPRELRRIDEMVEKLKREI